MTISFLKTSSFVFVELLINNCYYFYIWNRIWGNDLNWNGLSFSKPQKRIYILNKIAPFRSCNCPKVHIWMIFTKPSGDNRKLDWCAAAVPSDSVCGAFLPPSATTRLYTALIAWTTSALVGWESSYASAFCAFVLSCMNINGQTQYRCMWSLHLSPDDEALMLNSGLMKTLDYITTR